MGPPQPPVWLQDVRGTSWAKGVEEMITVDQKEIIRREYFLNRKSMREIARELRHGRAVIRKALYDPGIPVYKRSVPAGAVCLPAPIGPITFLPVGCIRQSGSHLLAYRRTNLTLLPLRKCLRFL